MLTSTRAWHPRSREVCLRPGETRFGQWCLGEAETQGAEEARGFNVQLWFMGTEPIECGFGMGRQNKGFAVAEVIEDQGGGEGIAGESAEGDAGPGAVVLL